MPTKAKQNGNQLIRGFEPYKEKKGEEYMNCAVPGAQHAMNGILWVPNQPTGHTTTIADRIATDIVRGRT